MVCDFLWFIIILITHFVMDFNNPRLKIIGHKLVFKPNYV